MTVIDFSYDQFMKMRQKCAFDFLPGVWGESYDPASVKNF
jgi:hypothetical protein